MREIDLGYWSGHTREEIARRYPEEWRRLEADEDISRGGGETYAAFQSRVVNWLEEAMPQHAGETILVVTHGGCVRAILLHALGLTWADRQRIPPIGNASITILAFGHGKWRVQSMNDMAHSETDPGAPPLVDDADGKIV